MKIESPDIDRAALMGLLREAFGLSIERLAFRPVGEDSYGYRAETDQGHYFVKLHPPSHAAGLESSLEAVSELRAKS